MPPKRKATFVAAVSISRKAPKLWFPNMAMVPRVDDCKSRDSEEELHALTEPGDLVVNSVELETPSKSHVGLAHFRYLSAQLDGYDYDEKNYDGNYDNDRYNFNIDKYKQKGNDKFGDNSNDKFEANYKGNDNDKLDAKYNDNYKDNSDANIDPALRTPQIQESTSISPSTSSRTIQETPQPPISVTIYPPPPQPSGTLPTSIFAFQTPNASTLLAIVLIAQQNLPSIDFTSALTHLPNRRSLWALPELDPYNITPWITWGCDILFNVVFLPDFYDDGRHALGYFNTVTEKGKKLVRTILFTPCGWEDLEKYFKWEDLADVNGGDRGGRWYRRDVEAEREWWRACGIAAGVSWEAVLKGMKARDVRS